MIVLGIDPGTATTGWGVVHKDSDDNLRLVDCGAVRTPASKPMPLRLREIFQSMRDLLAQHQPDAVAVEELFFSTNVRTAMSVGQARGVVMVAAALADLPVHEYTPLEIKQAISGYGGADKAQVQQMTALLLGLDAVPTPDDAADAIAVAVCHLHSARLQSLLAQQA
jgi:crossover junction endodeoxyribonuclease RuvC